MNDTDTDPRASADLQAALRAEAYRTAQALRRDALDNAWRQAHRLLSHLCLRVGSSARRWRLRPGRPGTSRPAA